jgi:hypothetical protein
LRKLIDRVASIALLMLAAGCSGFSGGEAAPAADATDRRLSSAGVEGSVFDMIGGVQAGSVRLGGGTEDAFAGGNVNRHLWRASLDTLAFMPIASTDPFTGVIATDWASTPDSPGERLKANVYITSTQLTPQALRVAVFREALRNGQWVAVPVAEDTPRRIEDAILTRARQLRIAEVEGNAQG